MLFSYFYRKGLLDLFLFLRRKNLIIDDILLDSGAFSAWTLGIDIDLEKYASWVRQVAGYKAVRCLVPSNLDVIPEPEANKAELEQCAQEGWQNYLRLKELGVEPMPVLHLGEKLRMA